jgi:hypothetical protein
VIHAENSSTSPGVAVTKRPISTRRVVGSATPLPFKGLELYQPLSAGGTLAVAGEKFGSSVVVLLEPGVPPIVTKLSTAGFAPAIASDDAGDHVPASDWMVFRSLWKKAVPLPLEIDASKTFTTLTELWANSANTSIT